jgi:hypothetical protein
MQVKPVAGGGLLIQSRKFLFHGRALPSIGLNVEFKSRVENETLKIDGHLVMKPKTKWGAFFAHKILRRPKNLGSIHYTANRKMI